MNYTYAEYFLGIGAPGKGFKRVTERHGDTCTFVYGFEIDKYARNAYAAIHGEDENKIYQDITEQPEQLPYVDIVFYSPPCQTFSIAGKKEGTSVDKGNLFYFALQGIKKSKPKYCIMENVANLKNQFKDDFRDMLLALEDAGYINYYKVLNSKDYGIPQNRERIFIVSIRKDIYEKGLRFEFPQKIKLKKRLKDALEDEVSQKYYLSEEYTKRFLKSDFRVDGDIKIIGSTVGENAKGTNCRHWVHDPSGIVGALSATDHKQPKQIKVEQVGKLNMAKSFNGNPQADRIYSTNGLCPALNSMQGGRLEPKILVNSATKAGYEIATEGDSINLDQPTSKTRRGRVGKQVAQTLTTSCNQAVYEPSGYYSGLSEAFATRPLEGLARALKAEQHDSCVVFPCIGASRGRYQDTGISQNLELNTSGTTNTLTSVQKDNYVVNKTSIRKLTPLECFRLQGFDDEDYYRAVIAYSETFGKIDEEYIDKLIEWKRHLKQNIKVAKEIKYLIEFKEFLVKQKSDSQMYKRAGNSITVQVEEELIENLIYQRKQEVQMSLF